MHTELAERQGGKEMDVKQWKLGEQSGMNTGGKNALQKRERTPKKSHVFFWESAPIHYTGKATWKAGRKLERLPQQNMAHLERGFVHRY